MNRVKVKPEMLPWAMDRSAKSSTKLEKKFSRLGEWLAGQLPPTLKQLEAFAKATFTPIGFFFLQQLPAEQAPIPDFRTVAKGDSDRPSPDLLDTVYLCQQRQEWYREFARTMGKEALPFVGFVRLTSSVKTTAAAMRSALRFDLTERRKART